MSTEAGRHFGLFCVQGTGHLYPIAAIGRALLAKGHRVSCFQDVRARALLQTAGIPWEDLGTPDHPIVATAGTTAESIAGPATPDLMRRHAQQVLINGCTAVVRAGVQALVVDQGDLAAGSIAERLGLPFVTVSFFPPIYLDNEVPPTVVGWRPGCGTWARRRNRVANRRLAACLAPIVRLVNAHRRDWGLPRLRTLNDVFSRRALIAQLPECLDFPRRRKPAHLHYAGPFQDHRGRYAVPFPWDALNGAPLIYASMGTVRNRDRAVFELIAEACAGLPAQLVVGLGGGLDPETLGPLPGSPLLVHYAPQLDLLPRAAVTITHAGLNTTLESLALGVPLVAVPVTDDQPGVGARIRRAGVGRVIPRRRLTVSRLRRAVMEVISQPRYRAAAGRIRVELARLDGPRTAVRIIEAACA